MQWEYLTVKMATFGFFGGNFDGEQMNKKLNQLGRDGWELAAAFDTNQSYGATRDIVLLFKRPMN